jgi:hypothetical protein
MEKGKDEKISSGGLSALSLKGWGFPIAEAKSPRTALSPRTLAISSPRIAREDGSQPEIDYEYAPPTWEEPIKASDILRSQSGRAMLLRYGQRISNINDIAFLIRVRKFEIASLLLKALESSCQDIISTFMRAGGEQEKQDKKEAAPPQPVMLCESAVASALQRSAEYFSAFGGNSKSDNKGLPSALRRADIFLLAREEALARVESEIMPEFRLSPLKTDLVMLWVIWERIEASGIDLGEAADKAEEGGKEEEEEQEENGEEDEREAHGILYTYSHKDGPRESRPELKLHTGGKTPRATNHARFSRRCPHGDCDDPPRVPAEWPASAYRCHASRAAKESPSVPPSIWRPRGKGRDDDDGDDDASRACDHDDKEDMLLRR